MLKFTFHQSLSVKVFGTLVSIILITILFVSWKASILIDRQQSLYLHEMLIKEKDNSSRAVRMFFEGLDRQLLFVTKNLNHGDQSHNRKTLLDFLRTDPTFQSIHLIQVMGHDPLLKDLIVNPAFAKEEAEAGLQGNLIVLEWFKASLINNSSLDFFVKEGTGDHFFYGRPFKFEGVDGQFWILLSFHKQSLTAFLPAESLISATLTDQKKNPIVRVGEMPEYVEPAYDNFRLTSSISPYGLNLKLWLDPTKQQSASTPIKDNILNWSVFCALVAILCGYLWNQRILGGISQISQWTQRIATGKLEHRTSRHSRDELEILNSSINHMVTQIGTLLEEVRERTRLDQEISAASLVHQTFFPKSEDIVDKKWLTIHRDVSSKLGASWWLIKETDDSIYLLMGTFSGEYVSSSLTTAMVYTACNLLLNEVREKNLNLEPKQISAMLNHILKNSVKDAIQANLFCCLIRKNLGHFTYVCDGFSPPKIESTITPTTQKETIILPRDARIILSSDPLSLNKDLSPFITIDYSKIAA